MKQLLLLAMEAALYLLNHYHIPLEMVLGLSKVVLKLSKAGICHI